MKKILALLYIISPCFVSAQAVIWNQWVGEYGLNNFSACTAYGPVYHDKLYSVLTLGCKAEITHYDSAGNQQSTVNLGALKGETGFGQFKLDKDNNYVIASMLKGTITLSSGVVTVKEGILVLKAGRDGKVIWAKTLEGRSGVTKLIVSEDDVHLVGYLEPKKKFTVDGKLVENGKGYSTFIVRFGGTDGTVKAAFNKDEMYYANATGDVAFARDQYYVSVTDNTSFCRMLILDGKGVRVGSMTMDKSWTGNYFSVGLNYDVAADEIVVAGMTKEVKNDGSQTWTEPTIFLGRTSVRDGSEIRLTKAYGYDFKNGDFNTQRILFTPKGKVIFGGYIGRLQGIQWVAEKDFYMISFAGKTDPVLNVWHGIPKLILQGELVTVAEARISGLFIDDPKKSKQFLVKVGL